MRGILLCDDMSDELMEIEALISRYYAEKRCDIKIYVCNDPKKAICCCEENNSGAAS